MSKRIADVKQYKNQDILKQPMTNQTLITEAVSILCGIDQYLPKDHSIRLHPAVISLKRLQHIQSIFS